MFDRLLNQIHNVHKNRQNNPKPFEVLWKKTCTELRKQKNATTYAQWKQQSIIKNASDYQALSSEIADTWANTTEGTEDDGLQTCSFASAERFDELISQQEALKPRAKINIDEILEVSIAYWIEARNAFNGKDSIRALHALLECNFYLGMTYSPKTESEAKREVASKAPTAQRDAIQEIAFEVMRNFTIPDGITSPQGLREKIVEQIRMHPGGNEAMQVYDDQIREGNPAHEEIDYRLGIAIARWARPGTPHERIATTYHRILNEFKQKRASEKQTQSKKKVKQPAS